MKVSLIYKGLPEDLARTSLMDSRFSNFYDAGHDRFFASLGELA